MRWEAGVEIACFRGGHNAVTGKQSVIHINSIIGTKGVPNINPHELAPGLTNSKLFARDRCLCAYCGRQFYEGDIRPLRVPKANERLDPPLVDVFVKGGPGETPSRTCAPEPEVEELVCG